MSTQNKMHKYQQQTLPSVTKYQENAKLNETHVLIIHLAAQRYLQERPGPPAPHTLAFARLRRAALCHAL